VVKAGGADAESLHLKIFGGLNIYFIYSSLIRTTARITDLISQCTLMVKLNRRILDRRLTSELTVMKIPSMAPVFGHKSLKCNFRRKPI